MRIVFLDDASIILNGDMDFYGHIFAYNGPDSRGEYYGAVSLEGNGNITGSLIGWQVRKTLGSATVTFPSAGGGTIQPDEPILFYGFEQGWEELNPL